jgi:hypothetical protein
MALLDEMLYDINKLKDKIHSIELERGRIPKALTPFNRALKVDSVLSKSGRPIVPLYGIYMGVCVDTRDPWKIGRIMVYCPIIHNLRQEGVSESNLSWASPCSPFGAIDDVGCTFIPTEGSTVLLMFQGGDRESVFYIGTTWIPKKADPSNNVYAFNPQREGYRWSSGNRNSDIKTGLKDSLMPPWNNESYYGNDLSPKESDQTQDSGGEYIIAASDTQNIQLIEGLNEERRGVLGEGYSTQGWRSKDIPHMYGIKTPEKHFILFDDGSYEREKKLWGKRLVVQSSRGNMIIMKDDCDKTAEEIYDNKYWDSHNDRLSTGGQAFDKIGNNHSVELNHTGIQIQSLGGGRLIIDDKIKGDLEEKQNEWRNKFPPMPKEGKKLYRTMVRLESHTEHRITLSDHHDKDEKIRSEKDGIFLSTACGHYVGMIDHTDMNGKADKERKIHIKSTSGHEIIFSDYQCKVKSPMVRSTSRYSGTGQRGYRDNDVYDRPNFQPNGKGMGEQVCIKIKSGFGQYMLFEDGSNQEKPTEQYIKISNAPGWNDPVNFLLMNQVVNKKLVHLNCAGERLTTVELNYTRVTVKDEILVSKEGNQIHVVEEQNMIDVANRKNIIQYAKLGDHIIFCRNGVHLTYALNSTMHLCLRNPHIILGEIPPDGEGKPPEGVAPVLLLGGDGPLPAHPAKYLIAN